MLRDDDLVTVTSMTPPSNRSLICGKTLRAGLMADRLNATTDAFNCSVPSACARRANR